MSIQRILDANNPRPAAPWKLKDLLWGSLAAVLFMGVGFGILFGIMALVVLIKGSNVNPVPFAMGALALEGVLIVPCWVWGPSRYGGGWGVLGLRRFKALISLALVVLSLVVIAAINALWEIARQRLGWAGQENVLAMFGGGIGGLLIALVLGGVIAPVAEEVFFRGFLYAGLRARWGKVWALLISAALFALVHITPGVLPPLFITGLLLAGLYELTDSLWPAIILHALMNSVGFVAMYLSGAK